MRSLNPDISSLSYSPYSGQTEACYILGESGTVYPGVRVENISFPLTIEAIQAAICSCLGNRDKPTAIIQESARNHLSDFWIQKFNLQILRQFPKNSNIFDSLINNTKSIVNTLKDLSKISVSDKSQFPVSALLKTNDGYIPGVNIEFEEWNLGLCAERVAITRAISSGYIKFSGMHIYAPKSEYISPCGACRQVLYELMPDQLVILHHDEESQSKHFVSHLLPNGFITNSLKK